MNNEILWNSIISELSSPKELQTLKRGFWFRASSAREKLYVDQATNHAPSSKISVQRPISKEDFLFVYSYFDRWNDGEKGVRQEVSRKSRNTAYIFALINEFDK